MKISIIYSVANANMILDTDVEISSDIVDTTSGRFREVACLLFDGHHPETDIVQRALGDVLEIEKYVAWADEQIAEMERAWVTDRCPTPETTEMTMEWASAATQQW